jgi:hypothetical protein
MWIQDPVVDSRQAVQEIYHVLWNSKFYFYVHKSPPLVPVLSQLNQIHMSIP